MRSSSYALLSLVGSLLAACAAAPPAAAPGPSASAPAGTAADGKAGPTGPRKASAPDVAAEVGALDKAAVKKNFDSLVSKVDKCHEDRRKQGDKLDFLSGDVSIEIHVAQGGSLKAAFLSRSTVGDRAVEKCILDAARALSWPRPEGGAVGIARNDFSLPMKGDREAVPWAADKVSATVSKAKAALDACKKGLSGPVEITAYVDTDGKVITAGASQPDPSLNALPDCLADAVKGLKFPSPGGWPARVTFATP